VLGPRIRRTTLANNEKKPIGKLKKGKQLSLGAAAKPQKSVELKVAMQDFHPTRPVDKPTPVIG
jgi:hypothetical protein